MGWTTSLESRIYHQPPMDKGTTSRHQTKFLSNEHNMQNEVGKLIARQADINIADAEGMTLLHNAVINGFESIVMILIEAGADVNIVNKAGVAPLYTAISNEISGQNNIVIMLIENQADISKLESLSLKSKSIFKNIIFDHLHFLHQESNFQKSNAFLSKVDKEWFADLIQPEKKLIKEQYATLKALQMSKDSPFSRLNKDVFLEIFKYVDDKDFLHKNLIYPQNIQEATHNLIGDGKIIHEEN